MYIKLMVVHFIGSLYSKGMKESEVGIAISCIKPTTNWNANRFSVIGYEI